VREIRDVAPFSNISPGQPKLFERPFLASAPAASTTRAGPGAHARLGAALASAAEWMQTWAGKSRMQASRAAEAGNHQVRRGPGCFKPWKLD